MDVSSLGNDAAFAAMAVLFLAMAGWNML